MDLKNTTFSGGLNFIIVGNGEEEEEIKRYAGENGLNLIVTGWTNTPYSYLKIFDVAVLLSRWEGFGLAIAGYMAAEKNLVATRVDAIPTIVDDGVDGRTRKCRFSSGGG